MKKIKNFFLDLARKPLTTFLLRVGNRILLMGVENLFSSLGLPESTSEWDHLTNSQVASGFLLLLLKILLQFLDVFLTILFFIAFAHWVYRSFRPKNKPLQKPE